MLTKPSLSLIELQNELTYWRSHRQPRHIPQPIREQAVRLLSQHKACEIKNALNINHRTLKQWKESDSEAVPVVSPQDTPGFIPLPTIEPLVPVLSTPSMPELKMIRHAGDGSAVSVEGTLSLEQWSSVLSLLDRAKGIG